MLRGAVGDYFAHRSPLSVGTIIRWAATAACAVLAGCAGAQDYVDAYAPPSPSVGALSICHGYGCRLRTLVRIEPQMQAELARLYDPAPKTAAAERARLARAIALFEIRIGEAVGTGRDRYAATTFNKNNDPGQLDCIDETVNTTSYMRLLTNLGLMRFHVIGTAAQRGSVSGFAFNDFVTNTAVIVEENSGEAYAVDSYFFGNGRQPKIMPLADWRKNWRPRLDDPNLTPVLVAG
jgi:hypothetical protein